MRSQRTFSSASSISTSSSESSLVKTPPSTPGGPAYAHAPALKDAADQDDREYFSPAFIGNISEKECVYVPSEPSFPTLVISAATAEEEGKVASIASSTPIEEDGEGNEGWYELYDHDAWCTEPMERNDTCTSPDDLFAGSSFLNPSVYEEEEAVVRASTLGMMSLASYRDISNGHVNLELTPDDQLDMWLANGSEDNEDLNAWVGEPREEQNDPSVSAYDLFDVYPSHAGNDDDDVESPPSEDILSILTLDTLRNIFRGHMNFEAPVAEDDLLYASSDLVFDDEDCEILENIEDDLPELPFEIMIQGGRPWRVRKGYHSIGLPSEYVPSALETYNLNAQIGAICAYRVCF